MIMSLLHVLQVTSPVYKFYHFHSLLYIFAAALVVSTAELGGVVALSLSLSLSLSRGCGDVLQSHGRGAYRPCELFTEAYLRMIFERMYIYDCCY